MGLDSAETDKFEQMKSKRGFNYTNKASGSTRKNGGSRFVVLGDNVEDSCDTDIVQGAQRDTTVLRDISNAKGKSKTAWETKKKNKSNNVVCQQPLKTKPYLLKKNVIGSSNSGPITKTKLGMGYRPKKDIPPVDMIEDTKL
ncbi:hypothetical protein ACOSP7_005261 [Xanthoceras sorbifolium]